MRIVIKHKVLTNIKMQFSYHLSARALKFASNDLSLQRGCCFFPLQMRLTFGHSAGTTQVEAHTAKKSVVNPYQKPPKYVWATKSKRKKNMKINALRIAREWRNIRRTAKERMANATRETKKKYDKLVFDYFRKFM